jgi:hypothetical protein
MARVGGGILLALGMTAARWALAAGSVPPGVARVKGDARVNGKPALQGMEVRPGDVITTGPGAEMVFVVGRDAYLARANTRIEFSGDAARLVVQGLRVVTGALLSVFQPGQPKRVQTSTATIGIRGTGLYVEVEDKRTYACLCYGEAELVPVDEPKEAEVVRTTHHDQPRYIYARGMPRMMEQAPVVNHTDAELIMLESLVGRVVPFMWTGAY